MEALVVWDDQATELAGVARQGEKAFKPECDLTQRRQLPLDLAALELVDDDRTAILLAGGWLHVGEAHAVIAVGAGIDGALPRM